jgi:hypothetical protein
MTAFSGPAAQRFLSFEVIERVVTARGLRRAVDAITATHVHDAQGRPIDLGPALYGPSRLCASRESFHLFRTCNVWTAMILREASMAVNPALTLTSSGLFRLLRRLAGPAPAAASAPSR